MMVLVLTENVTLQKIVSRCGGKIIIIDTGISHAYGGALSALSIDYTLDLAPELAADSKQKVWIEREVVKAVYMDGEVVLAHDEYEVTGDFA